MPGLPGVVMTRQGPLGAYTARLREVLNQAGEALGAAGEGAQPCVWLYGCEGGARPCGRGAGRRGCGAAVGWGRGGRRRAGCHPKEPQPVLWWPIRRPRAA